MTFLASVADAFVVNERRLVRWRAVHKKNRILSLTLFLFQVLDICNSLISGYAVLNIDIGIGIFLNYLRWARQQSG